MKVLASLLLLLTACGAPRDPEGTLDRARGGFLNVGVAVHEPWTTTPPGGIEVEILEGFAEEIGAELRLVPGGEEALIEALALGEVDIVIGGLTSKNPALAHVGMTRPYAHTPTRFEGVQADRVIAVRPGENALLSALERFLDDSRADIASLIDRQLS